MKSARNIWSIGFLACVFLGTGQGIRAQQWTSAGPIARDHHSAVLNTTTNRMIIFGGTTEAENTSSGQNLNDVWWLNGAGTSSLNWVAARPAGTRPAGRSGQSAVYDAVNDRMVIFGGGLGFRRLA